jgi:hypothetical protein
MVVNDRWLGVYVIFLLTSVSNQHHRFYQMPTHESEDESEDLYSETSSDDADEPDLSFIVSDEDELVNIDDEDDGDDDDDDDDDDVDEDNDDEVEETDNDEGFPESVDDGISASNILPDDQRRTRNRSRRLEDDLFRQSAVQQLFWEGASPEHVVSDSSDSTSESDYEDSVDSTESELKDPLPLDPPELTIISTKARPSLSPRHLRKLSPRSTYVLRDDEISRDLPVLSRQSSMGSRQPSAPSKVSDERSIEPWANESSVPGEFAPQSAMLSRSATSDESDRPTESMKRQRDPWEKLQPTKHMAGISRSASQSHEMESGHRGRGDNNNLNPVHQPSTTFIDSTRQHAPGPREGSLTHSLIRGSQ